MAANFAGSVCGFAATAQLTTGVSHRDLPTGSHSRLLDEHAVADRALVASPYGTVLTLHDFVSSRQPSMIKDEELMDIRALSRQAALR
jgi:hypothetical protein